MHLSDLEYRLYREGQKDPRLETVGRLGGLTSNSL